ncbi:hypothetical protein BN8_00572 [Fibrisoma limi BUZ 3]|uniref:Organic solvent tolerance-like N-terminal domain-containing protein n=1 Tax=Fibrisoma limi BUZ 3 TaxID=1185876 RepID=I2GCK9_9BACT|nr:hypothetical protein [Fibrisoma limi]CCH51633.1 hypothetical protein BN8_00572 [Fibrisoma limi BUZ 3]
MKIFVALLVVVSSGLSQTTWAQLMNRDTLVVKANTAIAVKQDLINQGNLLVEGTLHLEGSLINQRVIAADKGRLKLAGELLQIIFQEDYRTKLAVSHLIIKAKEVRLSHPLLVLDTVRFEKGIIDAQSSLNQLIISQSGVAIGASDSSHVVGVIEKLGNTEFIFPLGSGTSYRPVLLTPSNGQQTDCYVVEYSSDVRFPLEREPCLQQVAERGYWRILTNNESTPFQIGLPVARFEELGLPTVNPSAVRVAQVDSHNKWEALTCNRAILTPSGFVKSADLIRLVNRNTGMFTLAVVAECVGPKYAPLRISRLR